MNKDKNLVETDSPDVAEAAKETLITLLDKIQFVEPEFIFEYAQAINMIAGVEVIMEAKSDLTINDFKINPFNNPFRS